MESRTFHLVHVGSKPIVRSRLPDCELTEDLKSTQSSANAKPSVDPADDLDTDESVEANIIRCTNLRPSRRKTAKPELLKKSFKQELEKLGVSANQILEKNPTKMCVSRTQSPERESDEKVLLPFQRRARSNSPIRDELNMNKRASFSLFPSQGPVKASKPVVKKLTQLDDFSGIVQQESSGDFSSMNDEELEMLKEEYSKLLDMTVQSSQSSQSQQTEESEPLGETKKDAPKPPVHNSKKSKIIFM